MDKKKRNIIAIIVILLVFIVPIPMHLKDGGTVEYRALAYTVSKVHRLNQNTQSGYDDGLMIKIFGIKMYDSVSQNSSNENHINSKLIYENTISPNESFVEKEEDKVFYTIQIYQENNVIKVVSSSNSAFYKDMSYEIESHNEITENDVKIEWQTIMGDTNFTEDNQIAVAVISLYANGEMISQRKVNFVSQAIDIVVDIVDKNN